MTVNSYSAFRLLGYPCISEPRGNGNPRVTEVGLPPSHNNCSSLHSVTDLPFCPSGVSALSKLLSERCCDQCLVDFHVGFLPSQRPQAVPLVSLCVLSHAVTFGCRRHRCRPSSLRSPQRCPAIPTNCCRPPIKLELRRMRSTNNRSKMSRHGGILPATRASSGLTRLPMWSANGDLCNNRIPAR